MAVRYGAICYLDEIVEARQDTTVVIHPLTDTRRILPLEKHNEIVPAHADFQLTISYNPGYQSAVKDLKESTKQRFLAIDLAIRRRRSKPRSWRARLEPMSSSPALWSRSPSGRAIFRAMARRRRFDPDADPCRTVSARRPAA